MLSEFDGVPNVQEKLKLAFAEGYSLHSASDKKSGESKSWTNRAVRIMLYAFAFWCVIQLFQVSTSIGSSKCTTPRSFVTLPRFLSQYLYQVSS